MTTLSELFPQASSLPGGMTKDPRLLPKHEATNVTLYDVTTGKSTGSNNVSTTLGYTGSVILSGSDDTFATVCDITGAGVCYHIIPYGHTTAADVVTIEITVDGVVYTIAYTAELGGSNGQRFFLGAAGYVSTAFSASLAQFHSYVVNSTDTTLATVGGTAYLYPTQMIDLFNAPRLRFEEGLKVRVKCSDVQPLYGDEAYVTYKLDGSWT